MDLALDNQQKLICLKIQTTNNNKIQAKGRLCEYAQVPFSTSGKRQVINK